MEFGYYFGIFINIFIIFLNIAIRILGLIVLILATIALTKYIRTLDIRKDMIAVKKTLGETIKMYRMKNNMTQEYLADALGVSRQAVSKWEKGITDPSTSNLIGLAKVFNISVEDLLKNIE